MFEDILSYDMLKPNDIVTNYELIINERTLS